MPYILIPQSRKLSLPDQIRKKRTNRPLELLSNAENLIQGEKKLVSYKDKTSYFPGSPTQFESIIIYTLRH